MCVEKREREEAVFRGEESEKSVCVCENAATRRRRKWRSVVVGACEEEFSEWLFVLGIVNVSCGGDENEGVCFVIAVAMCEEEEKEEELEWRGYDGADANSATTTTHVRDGAEHDARLERTSHEGWRWKETRIEKRYRYRACESTWHGR